MEEIIEGYNNDLTEDEVELCADPNFNVEQMDLIL